VKIAVAIETRDRRIGAEERGHPPVNYLGQTLDNLARAGIWASSHLHSLHVVSGGEMPGFLETEVRSHGPLTIYPDALPGRTRQQNGAMAIQIAAETDADYVLKLEDDLDFCADFLNGVARWLGRYGAQDVNMFTLGMTFETYENSRYAAPEESVLGPGESFEYVRGWLRDGQQFRMHDAATNGGFWGAQAVLFRRQDALHCVEALGPDPRAGRLSNAGHDLLLGEWAGRIGVALPSFIQHLGEHSSIAKTRFFQFPWPGREWSFK